MRYKILIVFLLIFECCKAQSFNSFDYAKQHLLDPSPAVILVASHRGMHINYPENSIAAIQDAIDHHIDIVEIDVQITRDGIPVLMHDEEIDRTTTGSGKVKKMNYAEICEFRLLDKNGRETEFYVPSLAEVLELSKNKILLDIDLKLKTRYLKNVAQVIEEQQALNSVFFYHGKHSVLKKLEKYLPSAMRMTKVSANRRAVKRAMLKVDPEIVHLGKSEKDRDPVFIKNVQEYYRKPVFANALGKLDVEAEKNPDTLNYFIDKGINVIQTDRPDLVLEYLIARGKHFKF
ncbi:glycerophosphodiester phosphodiesterase family protein [Zunongwangia atlantica]|uniref:Glycerophosphoryl diester phosphodiesterase n=1 Tax=Zunongwangia atlantica 22II14-10F7 TaxID=1185767 RepID=A0A1Y1T9Z7_9FLAO|nr:glycerophosphodiester phosphodiesterase family protein [Zunongwangia atlantica]ORL47355.1 glycerophosphoryl diester phosphodiesterase [Zunongwangia atlantica 22II14-10F7]